MRLRLVPAGATRIGSPAGEHKRDPTDMTRRLVFIPRPFYIAKTATTQREYFAVTGKRPSYFGTGGTPLSNGGSECDDCPVDSVSWNDAQDFCKLLSSWPQEREAHRSYRLPTEVEWEHACRAGAATAFSLGDNLTPLSANFDGTFPYFEGPPDTFLRCTTPVRKYAPNAFGLFDFHGNVWEWCADVFCPDAFIVAAETPRVLRGGSWHTYARSCRCSARDSGEPDVGYFDQGFRVICDRGEAGIRGSRGRTRC